MSGLHAGFGQSDITPPVGVHLAGQFHARIATGVHDRLLARALALRASKSGAILVALDLLKLTSADVIAIREAVASRLPVPMANVWLCATHTHTGPALSSTPVSQRAEEYAAGLPASIAAAAEAAWKGAAPASVKVLRTPVEGVAFVRRFHMKDGTVRTNPGIGNPDIVEPVRTARTLFSLVEFDRGTERQPIVLASYPCHADVVGGLEVSADYPGRVCTDLSQRLPSHPQTLFLSGPCGDLNHVDVHAKTPVGGQEFAAGMARMLVDRAVEDWDRRTGTGGTLDVRRAVLKVPRKEVTAEELANAQAILDEDTADENDLTVDRLFARRVIALSKAPEEIELEVGALIAGELALVGLPGEVFSEFAERIEDASPYRHTFCTELFNNGDIGYLPTRISYEQGSYEPRSTRFAPGAGERMADAAIALLNTPD